jgi:choline dehydrogenase-like flavoprotein
MIMRDVIVVGAGGGGAVVAKELAGRGLDVLLLEAGARFADPERDWTHFESDANNPASGYFRFGPADRSKAPWVRDVASSMLLVQLAGVGGTTNHYQGNSPRAAPGAFAGYHGADAQAYDRPIPCSMATRKPGRSSACSSPTTPRWPTGSAGRTRP